MSGSVLRKCGYGGNIIRVVSIIEGGVTKTRIATQTYAQPADGKFPGVLSWSCVGLPLDIGAWCVWPGGAVVNHEPVAALVRPRVAAELSLLLTFL